MSDLSEILEQVISQKTDSLAVSKCQRINHYLRYVAADSYYYFVYGAPEEGRRTERVEAATQAGQSEEPIISTLAKKMLDYSTEDDSLKYEYIKFEKIYCEKQNVCINSNFDKDKIKDPIDYSFDYDNKNDNIDTNLAQIISNDYIDSKLEKDQSKDNFDSNRDQENNNLYEKCENVKNNKIKTHNPIDNSVLKENFGNINNYGKILDNEYFDELIENHSINIDFSKIPYYYKYDNTRGYKDRISFRISRKKDSIYKRFSIVNYISDKELLLDILKTFYYPIALKRYILADPIILTKQIEKLENELKKDTNISKKVLTNNYYDPPKADLKDMKDQIKNNHEKIPHIKTNSEDSTSLVNDNNINELSDNHDDDNETKDILIFSDEGSETQTYRERDEEKEKMKEKEKEDERENEDHLGIIKPKKKLNKIDQPKKISPKNVSKSIIIQDNHIFDDKFNKKQIKKSNDIKLDEEIDLKLFEDLKQCVQENTHLLNEGISQVSSSPISNTINSQIK